MISAVILTHNNEYSIEKTIISLKFCDEILIIDDNSADDTLKIAKKYNCKIIINSLDDDFSKQRNFGLDNAKGDWVLFVDSDEVVSKELAEEIINKINNNTILGYYLKRQDFLYGKALKYGETSNVKLLRLGKKGSGKWERSVHEIWNIKGKNDLLINPLLHYPHQTLYEFINDVNKYSTSNAKEFYKKGKKPSWFEIIAYPLGKFLQNYILRQGFRDKMPGLIVALMMSFHSFLTRGKLYLLWNKK